MVDATPPSLSVVICTYTLARWPDLVRVRASVAAQTVGALETIVVVDHNDDLLGRARRELDDVRVLANEREPGLSGARNSGIEAARGDVVVFVDDDAVADPDWLERLRAAYRDPATLAAGGLIEPLWLAGRPSTFPPEFDWVVGCTYRGHPTTRTAVRNVIGANMSFRRSVLLEAGGFRSDLGRVGTLPVGCEETELCLRSTRLRPDGVILYEPRARVVHTVPPARGTWSYFVRRCYGEGISKAVVARLAGRAQGLQTERRYVVRAIGRSLLRDIRDGLSGERAGFGRAARSVLGLFSAAAGYCVASLPGGSRTGPERESV
jgi:glycosyltransferase involved in cell wall biosynthesis